MVKKLFLSLFNLFSPKADCVDSKDFLIDRQIVSLPSPEGLQPISSSSKNYSKIIAELKNPSHELITVYSSESSPSKEYKIGDKSKYFVVHVINQFKDSFDYISSKVFSEFKTNVKEYNQSVFNKKRLIFGKFEKINGAIHLETENQIAYVSQMSEKGIGGKTMQTAVNFTALLVKGKILALYVYTPPSKVEWSKSICAKWCDKVLSLNNYAH